MSVKVSFTDDIESILDESDKYNESDFLHLENQDPEPFFSMDIFMKNSCTINLVRSFGDKTIIFVEVNYLATEGKIKTTKKFQFDSKNNYDNFLNEIAVQTPPFHLLPIYYPYIPTYEEIIKTRRLLITHNFIQVD